MLRFIESSKLPTRWGTFDIHGFEDPFKGKEHIAITMGDCASAEPLLIKIRSALTIFKTRVPTLLKPTSGWALVLICVTILSVRLC